MITPAKRLETVQEYYFSRKLKEVAEMNAKGLDVISLGIGSPDMPPSQQTIKTLCETAPMPNVHGYQPYVGIPELRQGFADFYDGFKVYLFPLFHLQYGGGGDSCQNSQVFSRKIFLRSAPQKTFSEFIEIRLIHVFFLLFQIRY